MEPGGDIAERHTKESPQDHFQPAQERRDKPVVPARMVPQQRIHPTGGSINPHSTKAEICPDGERRVTARTTVERSRGAMMHGYTASVRAPDLLNGSAASSRMRILAVAAAGTEQVG